MRPPATGRVARIGHPSLKDVYRTTDPSGDQSAGLKSAVWWVPGISRTFVPSASITMRRRLPSAPTRKYSNWLPSGDQRGCLRGDGIVREDLEVRTIQAHRGDLWRGAVRDRERDRRAVRRDVGCRRAGEARKRRSHRAIEPDHGERGHGLVPRAPPAADPSLPRLMAAEANNAIAATITAATARALSLRFRARRRCAWSWRASAPGAGRAFWVAARNSSFTSGIPHLFRRSQGLSRLGRQGPDGGRTDAEDARPPGRRGTPAGRRA